ncbi:MAG: exodeoxyribonuclease VII large subunit [Synergistaceae bacterium]|jgi:exodeoxyribonuclease VII large subunit|nr:exodeoxyribonuclease VII large subunit [Synergistaceae bacterium]
MRQQSTRLPIFQLSVDELTAHIQGLMASDPSLRSAVVEGEIAELKRHTSGHSYFTLLGKESRISCALFRQYAGFVPRWPENGDKVMAEGSVGVYPSRGVYQFYARRLVPVGEGAVARARQELREKLERDGLFSPSLKRPITPYPSRVALITSETGAAVWDVIRTAERLWPVCGIVVVGAQVQGFGAPEDIVRAFERVAALPGLDCVLLTRGGGSREDLVPFDDERVVRAVRACPVPVVSGVGHDIDSTLCDMAADLRASTPTAAAELVFPSRRTVDASLLSALSNARALITRRLASERSNLERKRASMSSAMSGMFSTHRTRISTAFKALAGAAAFRLAEAKSALSMRAASLNALSPLAVMSRGFAACERAGVRVSSAKELSKGDRISVRFSDGGVAAKVE